MFTSASFNRYASFSVSIIAAILGFIITLLFFDIIHATVFSVFILILYTLTRSIWLPEGHGKNTIRILSLGVASALLVPTPLWVTLLQSNWGKIQSILGSELPVPDFLGTSTANVVAATLIILIVNRYMARKSSILATANEPFGSDFPIKSYNEKLVKVAGALKTIISRIDHDLNWSSEFYTPLEAEVEVRGERKTITTLLDSIKKDKVTRKFLVLGDPGSGKSVALRKLAMEMLDETHKSGKIPLYINLKEWSVSNKWSEANPPSRQELQTFIVDRVSQKDHFVHEFFDEFFLPMLEHGRFFFLFDSFDEIPGVLDEEESSWLINELSQLFSQFIGGAHESRGILASRQFRSPTSDYLSDKTLEIRPFSDSKIKDALARNPKVDERIILSLFRERPDWISIARNPFNASLLAAYFLKRTSIPKNQADLFHTYLSDRFSKKGCVAMMHQKKIIESQLMQFCIDVGFYLYSDSELGLEVSKSRLSTDFGHDVTSHFQILSFALIARVAEDQDTVSFVHRRFTEYFISRHFVQNPMQLNFEVIPMDSSGRDGLVMYCETAPVDKAIEISEFCWEEISRLGELRPDEDEKTYRHAVLSLRFLSQSFRSRPECIDPFRENFSNWITNCIDGPVLIAKHSLEATGLLRDKELELLVVSVMRTNDPWLAETAIRACRHLGAIGTPLQVELISYLEQMTLSEITSQQEELNFSFDLSQAFSPIKSFLNVKTSTEKLHFLGHAFLFTLTPLVYIELYLFLLLFKYFLGSSSLNSPLQTGNFAKLRMADPRNWINLMSKNYLVPTRFFGLMVIVFHGFAHWSISFKDINKDTDNFSMNLLSQFSLLSEVTVSALVVASLVFFMPYQIIPLIRSHFTMKQMINIGFLEVLPFSLISNFSWAKCFKVLAKIRFAHIILASLPVAVIISMHYLMKNLPKAIQEIILYGLALFLSVAVAAVAGMFIRDLWRHYVNLRRVSKIEIPSAITRQQIVELLLSVNAGSRGKLLRKIADSATKVDGHWPPIRSSLQREILTELAKLDEKWIGLA